MTDKNWFDEFHAIDLKPYVDTHNVLFLVGIQVKVLGQLGNENVLDSLTFTDMAPEKFFV